MNASSVLIRELRVLCRRRSTFAARLVFTGTALLLWALMISAVMAGGPLPMMGPMILNGTTWASILLFGFGACISASDAISAERRNRTLGLLMLTPLRPAGILLGKLCSSSIQYLLCLLAVMPIITLPILMGGITFTDVTYQCLNILTVTLLGMATGFLASACCREVRTSSSLGLAGVLGLFVLLPLPLIACYMIHAPGPPHYLLVSLLYSLSGPATLAADSPGASGFFYFLHVGSLLALSCLFLLMALLFFRIIWAREANPAALPSGTRRAPPIRRTPSLAIDDSSHPYLQLARHLSRKGLLARIGWPAGALLLLFLLLISYFLVNARWSAWQAYGWFLLSLSYLILLSMELMMRWQACAESPQQIHGDRSSGMLELILTTPLPSSSILTDLRTVLRHSQRMPTITLCICHLIYMGFYLAMIHPENDLEMIFIMQIFHLGMTLLLPMELHALRSTGLASGLMMKTRLGSILMLFLFYGLLPIALLCVLLIGLTIVASFMPPFGMFNFQWIIAGILVIWFIGRLVVASSLSILSREKCRRIRHWAATRGID